MADRIHLTQRVWLIPGSCGGSASTGCSCLTGQVCGRQPGTCPQTLAVVALSRRNLLLKCALLAVVCFGITSAHFFPPRRKDWRTHRPGAGGTAWEGSAGAPSPGYGSRCRLLIGTRTQRGGASAGHRARPQLLLHRSPVESSASLTLEGAPCIPEVHGDRSLGVYLP